MGVCGFVLRCLFLVGVVVGLVGGLSVEGRVRRGENPVERRIRWIERAWDKVGTDGARRSGRIVNGDEVNSFADYPQLVSLAGVLRGRLTSLCTGAIVDKKIVITAAHCLLFDRELLDEPELSVCTGTSPQNGRCTSVLKYRVQPRFTNDDIFHGFDVGVLKTAKRLDTLGGKILKLSAMPVLHLQPAVSIGYGHTETPEDVDFVDELYELDTRVRIAGECDVIEMAGIFGTIQPERFLCADGNYDGSGGVPCFGDSGGPLIIGGNTPDEHFSVGIASFVASLGGDGSCSSSYEAVYTSLEQADNRDFVVRVAERFGGHVTFVEQQDCGAADLKACLQESDLSCVEEDADELCCRKSHAALDCLEPVYRSCGMDATAEYVARVRKELSAAQCPLYGSGGGSSSGSGSCFPASAVVHAPGGEQLPMTAVAPGHKVLVGPGRYSDVFGFSHRLEGGKRPFVRIEAADRSIELSPGHYLWVGGSLQAANTVRVGDLLHLANGTAAAVTSVRTVRRVGLFNPHTLDGNIVVNGIVASTYTQAVEPRLAHALLGLPRLLYRLGVTNPLGSLLHKTAPPNLLSWIPRGAQVAEVAMHPSYLYMLK